MLAMTTLEMQLFLCLSFKTCLSIIKTLCADLEQSTLPGMQCKRTLHQRGDALQECDGATFTLQGQA